MIFLFWLSFIVLFYAYFGYPLLLMLISYFKPVQAHPVAEYVFQPFVTIIIPVYNEERIIEAKIKNTLFLKYPREKTEIFIVSDGCTDGTEELVRQYADKGVKLVSLPARQGKASALNVGMKNTSGCIVIFSDASIMLNEDALQNIVYPFRSSEIGCVSGEDHISEVGGEGLYGKYELFLRNLESRVNSIVGASGCFYAQRRSLCPRFIEGMAPDFISVLATVSAGFRAITCPSAKGFMKSLSVPKDEYARKVRTFIRGITTLMRFKKLLNPLQYGIFSIELISHKLLRWWSAIFLIVLAFSNGFLLHSTFYILFFIMQLGFYGLAVAGWVRSEMLEKNKIFRIPYYFCLVNIAALVAWLKYLKGIRLEIWEPSKR